MKEFKLEEIRIGDKIIERITDENNIHWYPLKIFLTSILAKYDKVSSFRDSSMSRYMQVFELNLNRNGLQRPVKMWCINENGIKYMLRHMTLRKTKNKQMYKVREKALYEACKYFHVTSAEDLDPKIINIMPNLYEYDIWSVTCLKYDKNIKNNEAWKQCSVCNYYYPLRSKYFGNTPQNHAKCLQCQGKDFKCDNKVMQFIYDKGGIDLLYAIDKKNKDRIFSTLYSFIDKGGSQNL